MPHLKTMLTVALKPSQPTPNRILAVLTSCALALSLQPHAAGGQTPAAATPTATAAPTATAKAKTIEILDYVAKNSWLATGAVILDPFRIEDCTDKPDLCSQAGTEPDPVAVATPGRKAGDARSLSALSCPVRSAPIGI